MDILNLIIKVLLVFNIVMGIINLIGGKIIQSQINMAWVMILLNYLSIKKIESKKFCSCNIKRRIRK